MLTVICAMHNEADALLSQSTIMSKEKKFGKEIFYAEAFNHKYALIFGGIGKTNAAASAMIAVTFLHAEKILNFGLAGGISEKAKIGDVFYISRAVQYDFDLSEVNHTQIGTLDEYSEPYFYLPKIDSAYPIATLATGDRFTNSTSDLSLLNELNADVRDMEGAAIAHIAQFTKTPLFMYKGISDTVGENSVDQYLANTKKTLEALKNAIPAILGEIYG